MFLGALKPIKCPEGYQMYDSSLQSTFEDTCEPCRPGYYGDHPNRTECQPCRAGVVCHEAATTDQPLGNISDYHSYTTTKSYWCPQGSYNYLKSDYTSGYELKSLGVLRIRQIHKYGVYESF